VKKPVPYGAEEGICKGCGKRVLWVVNRDTGKRVPLDPAPPTYVSLGAGGMHVGMDPAPTGWFRSDAMVSHFATCPDASRFSGRNKEKP
jgi:hypothetical protein